MGRLKRLLATDDDIDAVLQGLSRRAEDGRLSAGDIDAVNEATRVASERAVAAGAAPGAGLGADAVQYSQARRLDSDHGTPARSGTGPR